MKYLIISLLIASSYADAIITIKEKNGTIVSQKRIISKKIVEKEKPKRLIASTSKAHHSHVSFKFEDGDYVIFGREKEGLSDEVYKVIPDDLRIKIPMAPNSRCLNLSNSVAVVAYEAWRQLGFKDALI